MMPSQDDPKKRVTRKLTKRRKEGHQVTMEIPKRFEDGDDADEDCTAPKGQTMMINQSVFGMIAAAGSQVDFNSRFEGSDDDEEDDTTPPEDAVKASGLSSVPRASKASAEDQSPRLKFHRRKFSENKLLRSLSHLSPKSRTKATSLSTVLSDSATEDQKPETEKPSTEMAEVDTTHRLPSKRPPVMGQMLEARAEAAQRSSFDLRRSGDRFDSGNASESDLANRLAEIFQFEKSEIVIDGESHNSHS
jgi:sterol 3beta-glucosyltransferase